MTILRKSDGQQNSYHISEHPSIEAAQSEGGLSWGIWKSRFIDDSNGSVKRKVMLLVAFTTFIPALIIDHFTDLDLTARKVSPQYNIDSNTLLKKQQNAKLGAESKIQTLEKPNQYFKQTGGENDLLPDSQSTEKKLVVNNKVSKEDRLDDSTIDKDIADPKCELIGSLIDGNKLLCNELSAIQEDI